MDLHLDEQELKRFVDDNEITVPDFPRLLRFLKDNGAFRLRDLAQLREEDFTEESSSLPKLQARKFVGCAQQLKVPSYGYMPSLGSATEYETANTDFSSDTTSVCNWSSGGSGSRYIAVRYMPCRDVFIGSIQPKLISGLDPERHTLLHLCDHIKNQERIENGFEVELFSHEGYPLNTNDYTINLPLQAWKIVDGTFLYVFTRPKEQRLIMPKRTAAPHPHVDKEEGNLVLNIHSSLLGEFPVRTDLGPHIPGEVIVQKVSRHTRIPANVFTLYSRLADPDRYQHNVKSMNSTEALCVTPPADITMVTERSYQMYDGSERRDFGKCTYNQLIPQTDEGYAAFYSALYYLAKGNGIPVTKLVAFLHKEYKCPPLTYAFQALMQDKQLIVLPCWVALVEGLYQLFKSLLRNYFDVPDNRVFEFSVHLWGMIKRFSKTVTDADSDRIHGRSISLRCPLSNLRLSDPVRLPHCEEVFDSLSVLEKIKEKEGIPQYRGPGQVTEGMLRPDRFYAKLLVYTAIVGLDQVFVWDAQEWETAGATELAVPELPPTCDWKAMVDGFSEFPVTKPDCLEKNTMTLTYYKNGNMAVFKEFTKDRDMETCALYDPLYVPTDGQTGEVRKSQRNMTDLAGLVEEINLQEYLKPVMEQQRTVQEQSSASMRDIRVAPQFQEDTRVQSSTMRQNQHPEEVVMIVTDLSGSMNEPIFSDERGHHALKRYTAASQLLIAFMTRTMAYKMNHWIGILLFADTVLKVKNPCEISRDLLEYADFQKASGQTKLYDAMMKAACKLVESTRDFPECQKRILCLTDGLDNNSKVKPLQLATFMNENNIVVDTVLLTGPDGNKPQKAISHSTEGFCFIPESITAALKLFEMESLLNLRDRVDRHLPLWQGDLQPFMDTPYDSTDPYGYGSTRMRFAEDLDKVTFTSARRVLQEVRMIGIKAHSAGTKRIMREISDYQRDPHPDVEIFPSEEDIHIWKLLLKAPEGTPYENGIFLLCAKFPPEYPQSPPVIRFLTPVYHCNINSSGRICHSVLERNYRPSLTMREIIGYICGLLMAPEGDDPLDSVLAEQFHTDHSSYLREATSLTQKYAVQPYEEVKKQCIGELEDADAPDYMVCPLTKKLFVDPVSTRYGHTYEKEALEEYLKKNNNLDPVARMEVDPREIHPNTYALKSVRDYRKTLHSMGW